MNLQHITLKINGVIMPYPSELDMEYADIDSDATKRNITQAKLIRKRIRSNILSLSIKYNLSDLTEAKTVINAISAPTFMVELFSVLEEEVKTKEMYAGNKKFKVKYAGGEFKAVDLAFSLIEV